VGGCSKRAGRPVQLHGGVADAAGIEWLVQSAAARTELTMCAPARRARARLLHEPRTSQVDRRGPDIRSAAIDLR
jgi:hypothetical protein